MKIAVLKERYTNEKRVAITPDIVKRFIDDNFNICVQSNAGLNAGFSDEDYAHAGAKISNVPLEIVADADIIVKIHPEPASQECGELEFAKKGAIIIGLLNPTNNTSLLQHYATKGISSLALELLPRISKAQSMDVLSSQSNLAGYRSVIEGAHHYGRAFPMMITAAGTILAAKVLVLGAGVAGLQAIATAKRLGAVVYAYDVRSATKEQAQSLGAQFINTIDQDLEGAAGYANEMSDQHKAAQAQLLEQYMTKVDIVITTAQIPGKPAPILITKKMIAKMRRGSVIVDLAAINGGNTELTKIDQVVECGGVKIVGYGNIASLIAGDSSKLYAKNVYNLIKHIFSNNKFDAADDIVKPMLLTHKGKVLYGLQNR